MNSNGILFLTVNADGRVRSWKDTQESLLRKEIDETVVQLSLTKTQMATMLKAEGVARRNINDRLNVAMRGR